MCWKLVWHVFRKLRTSFWKISKNYFSHLVMRTSGTRQNSKKMSKFHKNAVFCWNLECSIWNQKFLQSHSMGLKPPWNTSATYLKQIKSAKYFPIGCIISPIFWLLCHEFFRLLANPSKKKQITNEKLLSLLVWFKWH